MMKFKHNDFVNIVLSFLSGSVEDVCNNLEKYGIITRNTDGTYKAFNEVLEQIYEFHMPECVIDECD